MKLLLTSPKRFFDDLQSLTGNKTYEKVAQSIDSFIDELAEWEESSFTSQTRTIVNLTLALQQDVDLHNLSSIPLSDSMATLVNGPSLLKTSSQEESIQSKHLMITLG